MRKAKDNIINKFKNEGCDLIIFFIFLFYIIIIKRSIHYTIKKIGDIMYLVGKGVVI